MGLVQVRFNSAIENMRKHLDNDIESTIYILWKIAGLRRDWTSGLSSATKLSICVLCLCGEEAVGDKYFTIN